MNKTSQVQCNVVSEPHKRCNAKNLTEGYREIQWFMKEKGTFPGGSGVKKGFLSKSAIEREQGVSWEV